MASAPRSAPCSRRSPGRNTRERTGRASRHANHHANRRPSERMPLSVRARQHQGSRKSREQEVISSTYVFSCFSASFSRSCLLVGTVLYRVHGSNFRSCEPNRRGGCALLLVYRAELSGRVTLVTYLRRWNPSDACHTNSHSRRRLAGMGHDGYKPPRCTTTS
jgi:hypothetical protein